MLELLQQDLAEDPPDHKTWKIADDIRNLKPGDHRGFKDVEVEQETAKVMGPCWVEPVEVAPDEQKLYPFASCAFNEIIEFLSIVHSDLVPLDFLSLCLDPLILDNIVYLVTLLPYIRIAHILCHQVFEDEWRLVLLELFEVELELMVLGHQHCILRLSICRSIVGTLFLLVLLLRLGLLDPLPLLGSLIFFFLLAFFLSWAILALLIFFEDLKSFCIFYVWALLTDLDAESLLRMSVFLFSLFLRMSKRFARWDCRRALADWLGLTTASFSSKISSILSYTDCSAMICSSTTNPS